MVVGHTVARRYGLFHQAERIVLAWIVRTNEYLLFAIVPRVAHRTGAYIRCQFVHTHTAILTRRRFALVDLFLTDASMPAGSTFAGELQARTFNAFTAVLTTRAGARLADSHIDFTIDAQVARLTGAGIAIVPVTTMSTILTRIRHAFIDIFLAIDSSKTIRTRTVVIGDAIYASATVLAGPRPAFIPICLALNSRVTIDAVA